MPNPKSIYRRLGGQGATLTYYTRLYLGPDHLLQAAFTGYSESYKRFYFRDIQAIIIQRTKRRLVWNWILGLLAMPPLGVAIWEITPVGPRDAEAFLGWMLVAALFLVPLVVNILLGPSCVCYVRTAVQTEKIPSLKRLRTAQKILAQLKPRIETAQGKAVENVQ